MILPPLEKILVEISDEIGLPITPRQYAEEYVQGSEIDDITGKCSASKLLEIKRRFKELPEFKQMQIPEVFQDIMFSIFLSKLVDRGDISVYQAAVADYGKPFEFGFIRLVGRENTKVKGESPPNVYGFFPTEGDNLDCSAETVDGMIEGKHYFELIAICRPEKRTDLSITHEPINGLIKIDVYPEYRPDRKYDDVLSYDGKRILDTGPELKGALKAFINGCGYLL